MIRQDRHLESLVSQPGPPPLKPRAYQLIEAAQVAGNLSTIVDKPTNEAQVRPLTGLEPEQQREVWDNAVETALPSSTPGGRVKVVLNDGDKNLIASSTHLRILLDSFLLPRKDQHYANSPQYPHSP